MQELINEVVAKDIADIDRATSHAPASWEGLLKQKIYNAYLRITDGFKESIYKQKGIPKRKILIYTKNIKNR